MPKIAASKPCEDTALQENEGMLALGRKPGFKIFRSAEPGEMELTIGLRSNKF
ncbi:MAG: hypothetical protein WBC36_04870 [Desulfobacterales bacterium]